MPDTAMLVFHKPAARDRPVCPAPTAPVTPAPLWFHPRMVEYGTWFNITDLTLMDGEASYPMIIGGPESAWVSPYPAVATNIRACSM